MSLSTRQYGNGTELTQSFPWGLYVSGRALCPDGRVRKLKRIASTADTYFSIPASVTAYGRTVAGFISFREENGVETVCFTPVTYRKNHDAFADRVDLSTLSDDVLNLTMTL